MVDDTSPWSERSLRADAVAGGRWTATESILLQLGQIATTAALARLLVPQDYGVVAVATIVVGLFSLFTQVGLAASLMRRTTLTSVVVSTYFWASVVLGLLAAIVAASLAVPLAGAFGDRAAAPLIAALAVILILGTATTVADAELRHALRFRARALIQMLDYVVYAVTAILLAATTDAGAWSIVLGRIGGQVVSSAAFWLAVPIKPRLELELEELRSEIGFNLGVLGSRLMGYVSKNVDYWFVGATLGPEALGFYFIAYTVPSLARQRMTWAAQRVLFPVLAKMTDDFARVSSALLTTARFTVLLAYPALIGIGAIAESLVPVLFGSGWQDSITPLSILAVGAAIESVNAIFATAFTAAGRSMVPAVFNGVRLIGFLIAAYALRGEGLVGVAFAVVVGSVLATLTSIIMAKQYLRVQPSQLAAAVRPALLPTLAMLPAIAAAQSLTQGAGRPLRLLVQVAAGAATYLASGLLMHRPAFRGWLRDLRSFIMPHRTQ